MEYTKIRNDETAINGKEYGLAVELIGFNMMKNLINVHNAIVPNSEVETIEDVMNVSFYGDVPNEVYIKMKPFIKIAEDLIGQEESRIDLGISAENDLKYYLEIQNELVDLMQNI